MMQIHEWRKQPLGTRLRLAGSGNGMLCRQWPVHAVKLFSIRQIFWEVVAMRCTRCNLAYKEYLPNSELLTHLYGAEYVHFADVSDVAAEPGRYTSRVRRMGRPRGRHLDYGYGAGYLVLSAIQAGWDRYGVAHGLPARHLVYVDACACA